MIISSNQASGQSSETIMASWLELLQKNSKSEEQLQMEMVNGVSETIEKIQEKVAEKAEEAKSEADGTESSETTSSSDEIKAPSEVTKADLESPIDIKL